MCEWYWQAIQKDIYKDKWKGIVDISKEMYKAIQKDIYKDKWKGIVGISPIVSTISDRKYSWYILCWETWRTVVTAPKFKHFYSTDILNLILSAH